MATRNPARLLGLENKGVIAKGADVDVVLWGEAEGEYVVEGTWVGGEEEGIWDWGLGTGVEEGRWWSRRGKVARHAIAATKE